MKNDSPCFHCPKHSPECHAGCEEYAKWRKAMDKEKAEQRKTELVDQYIIENMLKVQRKTNQRRTDNGCI